MPMSGSKFSQHCLNQNLVTYSQFKMQLLIKGGSYSLQRAKQQQYYYKYSGRVGGAGGCTCTRLFQANNVTNCTATSLNHK